MLIDVDKFKEYSYNVYEQIKNNQYDGIIAILNGGFYLADFLSKKMNLQLYTINVKSYEGDIQKDIKLLSWNVLDSFNGKYLIVDDIYDTGNTIDFVKKFYSHNCKVILDEAVLVSKNESIKHGFFHKEDDWIYFYWETY